MPAPDAAWWPLPEFVDDADKHRYPSCTITTPTGDWGVWDRKHPSDQEFHHDDDIRFVIGRPGWTKNPEPGNRWLECDTLLELRVTLMRLAGLTPSHPDTTGGHDDGGA